MEKGAEIKMNKKYFNLFLVLPSVILILFSLNFVLAWTDTGGGDHNGADWTPSNWTNLSGNHYNIGTFTILPSYTIFVDGYQKTAYGGNATISATTINISGTLDASGRGFGGGGGGSNVNYNCVAGIGGSNGIGGTGQDGKWMSCTYNSAFGGGGGGSPNGAGGSAGGTSGTLNVGGTGGNACRGTGGVGGTGYGAGGGGGGGCTAGGGGGGGGGSGGLSGSNNNAGNGTGNYYGAGGAGTTTTSYNNGTNGGYRGSNSNNDSSLDTNVYMGSGGGGGGSTTYNGAGGGAGAGAGGGSITLNATTITISGNVSSKGAGGGVGAYNSDYNTVAGYGGGGAGGGVAVLGCSVNLSGTFDLRGRQINSLSTTNAGSLKIFYETLTNNSVSNSGRVYSNPSYGSAGLDCAAPIRIVYPFALSSYNYSVSLINYTINASIGFQNCWWSNSSGVWNSSSVIAGDNFTTEVFSVENTNNLTIYCNDTNSIITSRSNTFYVDTTSPLFLNLTNQNSELGFTWNYSINTSDFSGVSCFSVNDTNFTINCTGYLRNSTALNAGIYLLNISANDTLGNTNYSLISVNVSDTLAPLFSTLANQTSEYGSQFNYSINATDISGISCYSVNDTTNFNINCTGYLKNNTLLSVGVYWLNITVNDSLNHINSTRIKVTISDTTYPRLLIVSPSNNTNTTDTGLDINYTATDLLLSNCWYSNDSMSVNYSLSGCQNITTVVWTEGQHNLTIWINDTSGNVNKSTIRFYIDTTSPRFNNITNQTVFYGTNFSYSINATDALGISCFNVNDANFTINCTGYLRNSTLLSVGNYSLNVSVNDSVNNTNTTTFLISVNTRPQIGLQLISPTGSINASQDQLFNVSVNVSCSVADCGQINLSLDPDTIAEILPAQATSAWGSGNTNPQDAFNTYFHDSRTQSIYLASELTSAGLSAGVTINTIYFNVSQIHGRPNLKSFRIRMQPTTQNTSSGWITSNWTTVFGPTDVVVSSIGWVQFNLTTNFTWDGSANIIIDLSRDDTAYSSNGGMNVRTGLASGRTVAGYSDSGYSWPFDSMSSSTYSVVPAIKLKFSPLQKSGLVSMNAGALPFYTATQNPYNLTLNNGQSQIVNWTVNATGVIGTTSEFFIYANLTNDGTVRNATSKWNVTIVIDPNAVPSITINYPVNNSNYTTNISQLNYTATGNNLSRCWYSLNNGVTNSSDVTNGTNFTNVISSEAWNNWTVYCNTSNGIVGSALTTFYKDSTAPNITLNSPSENYTNSTVSSLNVTFNCSATDNLVLKNISLYITNSSNGNFSLNRTTNLTGTINSSSWNLTLIVGIYTWGCLVSDSLGNLNWSANRTINISLLDLTAPTINIIYPINNSNYTTNISQLNYTATDNVAVDKCWWSNSSGVWNSSIVNSGTNFTGIISNEGWNNWTIYCNDTSGNVNFSRIAFFKDSVAPNITLNSPSENYTTGTLSLTNVTFNCSAVDNSALKNISLYLTNSSNGNFSLNRTTNLTGTSNSSSWNLTLGVGNYTWGCLVSDSLGNLNWSANRTINISFYDSNPPTINITYPVNNTNYANITALNYTVTDDANASKCWWSNSSGVWNFSIVNSGTNWTGIISNEGWNNWTVYCNDTSNNVGTANVNFYIDSTPPFLEFVSPTLANFSATLNNFYIINTSIKESSLGSLIYNWNGTNYTIYNNSLILMMNFDNLSALGENSTRAIDLSRFGNNGTVNSSTWTSSGKYNGAYNFDGVDDSININALNLTTNSLTISAWIKGNYTGSYSPIIYSRDSIQAWGIHYRDVSGQLAYTWNNNSGSTYGWTSGLSPNATIWTFVVLTINSTQATLYMSNSSGLYYSINLIAHIPQTLGTSINIGYDALATNRRFNGSIDEVRIWNRTLSANEVYEQYVSNLQRYNSTQWYFYANQSKNATAGLSLDNYTYQMIGADSVGNLNQTEQRIIILQQNFAPNITLNSPSNNTILNRLNPILLNASVTDPNGYLNNMTIWFYGGYANGTYAVINTTYNKTNGSFVTFNWSIPATGKYNWTVVANDGYLNSSIAYSYFNVTNFTLSCEAGGAYQQGALVLIQGILANSTSAISSNLLNISIYNSSNGVSLFQNSTTASDGGYRTNVSNLSVGNYVLNVTTTYQGYNESCGDNFSLGSPASFVLDKIITILNMTNTTIDYNITLSAINKGGSDANSSVLTDSNSADSSYNLGTFSANSSIIRSYTKSYSRNSSSYNLTLAKATINGTDSYSGTLISANSSEINLIIPASDSSQQLTLIKNVYYNSENSTHVNYTISISIVNSGGVDLANITLIDSDLSLSSLISLNRTGNYNYSSYIVVAKAASNADKLFTKTTATINSVTYYSNQINVRIPGYGGPADAIVHAPSSVEPSKSFDTTINVENQNPDIGQDFTINYWIANSDETTNYSSGQQTIYVAASGASSLTAILTSPSSAGNYKFRASVSWAGGTATAYDSFAVTSSENTIIQNNTESSGGGSAGINLSKISKDIVVCNPPYIRYGTSCCLDKNNNSICDSDEKTEETQINQSITGLTNYNNLSENKKTSDNKKDQSSLKSSKSSKTPKKKIIKNVSEQSSKNIIQKVASAGKNLFSKTSENSSTRSVFILIIIVGIIFGVSVFIIRKIKKTKPKQKDNTHLNNIFGMKVYSSEGNFVGKIKEIYLEKQNPRIYGWLIKVDKNIAEKLGNKFILIKHNLVTSINEVMIIDKEVTEKFGEFYSRITDKKSVHEKKKRDYVEFS